MEHKSYYIINIGKPQSFSNAEIDYFFELVQAGGEVAADGLRDRILRASHLVYAKKGDDIIGIAALKKPLDSYRFRIAREVDFEISPKDFPLELGWVYVLPNARCKGISGELCRTLILQSEGNGIFATSRVDNVPMHRTMQRLGFERAGRVWQSKQNNEMLALFIRIAV